MRQTPRSEPSGWGVDMFVCSMGCAVSPSGTEGGIRPDWEGLASQISVYANSRAVTVGPAQCRVAGTRPTTLPCLSLRRSHVRWAWNRGGGYDNDVSDQTRPNHPEITTRHESRHLSRQIRGQERQMQRDTFVKYFSLGRAHCLKNYLSPSFSRMARMDPGVELSVSIFQNAVYFQSVNSIISLCPDCVLLCIFEYLLFHFSEF